MGLFDRILRDLTNNVIDSVERKATDEIINPQIDKIAENAKNMVVQQVAQAEDAIYSAPPVIALDKENYNNMLIASRDKLYFMDKVLGGSPKKVAIKMMATFRFSAESCGDMSSNTDAASQIHSAIIDAVQSYFDDSAAHHMTMAAAIESTRVVSAKVIDQVRSLLDTYGITTPQLLFTCLMPYEGTSDINASTVNTQPASWKCQYCGSINEGKFCVSCGAPQE